MYDLAVIGGGVTGLLLANRFQHEKVVLIDDGDSKNSKASLWSVMPPLCGDLYDDCISAEKAYEELCERLGVPFRRVHIIRKPEKGLNGKKISREDIRALEPSIDLDEAEYFDNGLFVEGEDLLMKLRENLNVVKAEVVEVVRKGNRVESVLTTKGEIKASNFAFTTGFKTSSLFPEIPLQLYKGHLITTRKVGLRGILIYKDRIAVEGRYLYLNGDSVKDTSKEVNYEEVNRTLRTLSEVLSVDTQDISVRVGFRTVSQDGRPIVRKVAENALLVTGYRFGFALAPVLVERARSQL
ncbi:MAG: FAD dependent oxidoreductase [Candidatus Aramenus sulfurataquae]|jgi:glycine/D-amino acid oxidase-like deaminating enzyme|uniref:FAD dependent oxidoreductase n=3 Tax=Candidatus Aramenus sulfurataquae TaxID=1326980 RepID=W7KMM5_9CREN|nr:MAG: FAD dependent oxidoreductase [Candidatus Aramenus sulfurataquae]MCL7343708.1 FAD-binding oxidoreductase [Candidatus Aramenus sulfurataquae]